MTPPESPEVVGARARARVAAATPRRPVAVLVVSPSIRREQTPAMPHEPKRYTPVSLAASPYVEWTGLPCPLAVAAVERTASTCARFVADPSHPCAPTVPPAPVELPDLDVASVSLASSDRRARMARLGGLLREAASLLVGESPGVVEKARAALLRGG